ncbi:hypothetical protein ACQ86N_26430 [Puia sp. P3]|uniref:hypothetical protein n=1 Tax=Puia sp. P3 TaxID=3423952 RepID=UPI003D671CB6
MGKYLQDVMYRLHVADRNLSLFERQIKLIKSIKLVETLFNFYLPKKIEIGNNIWRLTVYLTSDKNLDGKTEEVGLVQASYIFYDFDHLLHLARIDQKRMLTEVLSKGIQSCCAVHCSPFEPFESISHKLLADKVEFSDYYKERKISPDKMHIAQMKVHLSEEEGQLSVTVFDRGGTIVKSIAVGEFQFGIFDRIQWMDNRTLNVYHINAIQSYRRKKVALDYFSINIGTEIVTYHPVTRESIFDYGVKLLTETTEYEVAFKLINQAKALGDGKAENILQNLAIDPGQRDNVGSPELRPQELELPIE